MKRRESQEKCDPSSVHHEPWSEKLKLKCQRYSISEPKGNHPINECHHVSPLAAVVRGKIQYDTCTHLPVPVQYNAGDCSIVVYHGVH